MCIKILEVIWTNFSPKAALTKMRTLKSISIPFQYNHWDSVCIDSVSPFNTIYSGQNLLITWATSLHGHNPIGFGVFLNFFIFFKFMKNRSLEGRSSITLFVKDHIENLAITSKSSRQVVCEHTAPHHYQQNIFSCADISQVSMQRPRWMNSITQACSGQFITAAAWRPSSIHLKNGRAGTKNYCSLHISLCLLTASGSPADTCPDSRVNTACAEQWFIAFSHKRLKLPFGCFKYQQLSWKLFQLAQLKKPHEDFLRLDLFQNSQGRS